MLCRLPQSGARQSGFSMIEMLIVVAILAILGTLSLVYTISAKPSVELQKAEEELVFTLSQARNLALSEELSVRVIIDDNTNEYWFEQEDRDNPGVWTISTPGAVKYKLPASVKVVTNTFFGETVMFTPRGTLMAGGSITLEGSNGQQATLVGNIATGRFPLSAGGTR